MKNWLRLLLVASCLTLGCETSAETWDVDYPDDEVVGTGGSMQLPPTPGGNDTSDDEPSDVFDPCPKVAYIVEIDGQQHVIELRVFCDPMQDVYKGCPAPDVSGL